ncbi:hypothetical protein [Clostridium oryzae]|uniref:Uncharacterized protein n=1 Tax=Clostridium oryzae TaxID=1450648 RepID=A0A1V4IJZ6_9CLOT|nr:hypothetical protein [Clostridium oryzae]OPJ60199.1 hypothetical protein CLORY_29200 [Clostridium oryzae]
MKTRPILKKSVAFLLLLTCVIFLHQPLVVNAASTTEKKASVKFTKAKISGFTKISTLTNVDNYLVALGKKAKSNTLAYSRDGINFKNISLDSAVNKKYNNEKISSIEMGSYHPYYVRKRGIIFILGSATTSKGEIHHFIVSITKSMKTVSIISLDSVVKKLNSKAKDMYVDDYANCNYEKGYITIIGAYYNTNNSKVPFYILSKNGSTFTAYKTPSTNAAYIDFIGNYLVSYGWPLDKASNGRGAFYYSKDCTKWIKATTPKHSSSTSWNRSFFKWDNFCTSPENNSSNKYKLFYTKNMKDYKSISKDYVVKDNHRSMNFDEYDNKYIAEEHGLGSKNQLVISERSKQSGSRWKVLLNYKQKNFGDFYYNSLTNMDGGVVIIKDGNTKKIYTLKNRKSYGTTIDVGKLDMCYFTSTEAYGGYDKQYILATKNSFTKNYLFKAPIKFNKIEESSNNKFGERMYVYSDSAVYFVSKTALEKAMK